MCESRTMDTQWRNKSKKSKNLGQCGRRNVLRSNLKFWERELIFSRPVKVISSPSIHSPYLTIVFLTIRYAYSTIFIHAMYSYSCRHWRYFWSWALAGSLQHVLGFDCFDSFISRMSNIDSNISKNSGLEDYNNISDGIFPYITTPSIKISLG